MPYESLASLYATKYKTKIFLPVVMQLYMLIVEMKYVCHPLTMYSLLSQLANSNFVVKYSAV